MMRPTTFRIVVVLLGVTTLGVLWLEGAPLPVFYVFTPIVVLSVLLTLRAVRFCGACGRRVTNYNPFGRIKTCTSCGKALK